MVTLVGISECGRSHALYIFRGCSRLDNLKYRVTLKGIRTISGIQNIIIIQAWQYVL